MSVQLNKVQFIRSWPGREQFLLTTRRWQFLSKPKWQKKHANQLNLIKSPIEWSPKQWLTACGQIGVIFFNNAFNKHIWTEKEEKWGCGFLFGVKGKERDLELALWREVYPSHQDQCDKWGEAIKKGQPWDISHTM